jgi:hypothetical protein
MRATACLLIVFAACIPPAVTGQLYEGGAAGSSSGRAAIAIRDHVPAYQKFATEQFTVPRLEAAYDRYWYFTEGENDSRHDDFVEALKIACSKFGSVDIYLLTNGLPYIEWVREVPADQRAHIRLVYNTGGGGASEGEEWVALGVKAYVAHPGSNVAPVFYVYFLPAWTGGMRLADAVDGANAKTHEHLFGKSAGWFMKLAKTVDENVDADKDRLWKGTQAQVFGSVSLRHDR